MMTTKHTWLAAGALAAIAVLPAQNPDSAQRRPVRTMAVRAESAQAILPGASPYEILVHVEGVRHYSSTNPAYRDWMEAESWAQQVDQPVSIGSGSGGGAGRATFSDLSVSGMVDPSMPQLAELCATGNHVNKVELVVLDHRVSTTAPILRIELTRAILSSVRTDVGPPKGTQSALRQTIEFAFEEISWEAAPPSGGAILGGWNVVTNQKA